MQSFKTVTRKILFCNQFDRVLINRERYMHTSVVLSASFSSMLPKFILRNRNPNVAVINLHGTIQAQRQGRFGAAKTLNLDSLEKNIEKAFSLKRLQEVCLIINSPGGSPVQSELITDKITRCAQEKNVHTVSFVEDMAASGGYWLACAGKEIFAAQNSVVGSIGAVMGLFGFHELIKHYGIERRIYAAGKNKVKFDVFSPEKPDDIEYAKKMLQEIHENFKDYVKQKRGVRLKSDDEILFNGDVWISKEALKLGLIDGIQTFDGYIKQKYGKDVKIVCVNPSRRTGLAGLLQTSVPSIDDLELLQKYKIY